MGETSTDTLIESSTPPSSNQPERRGLDWHGIVAFLTLLACLPTLLAAAARWHWTLDLFCHFRVYYALALLLGVVVSIALGNRRTAAVAGLVLAWNLVLIAPLYVSSPAASAARTPAAMQAAIAEDRVIRGMSINILSRNGHHDELLTYVRQEDPDFVFFMEVNDVWAERLQELEADYPHHVERWRNGNFGVSFYSRLEAKSLDIEVLSETNVPSVVAVLTTRDGVDFTVLGTHPVPPTGPQNSRERNEQLRALAAKVAETAGPVMLMGDLNATSWSPHFQDLLRESKLHDSRIGFGVQGTWAPRRFVPKLPIDHVLTTGEFAIHDRRVGPDIGSDHRPVTVDFHVGPRPSPQPTAKE